jgi:hypothetical protein
MESALVDRNEKGYILAYRMHAALLKVLLRELKERKDKATEWFHSLPVTETNFPDLARWYIGESDMPHEAEEQYAGAWPVARHGACYEGQGSMHTTEPFFVVLFAADELCDALSGTDYYDLPPDVRLNVLRYLQDAVLQSATLVGFIEQSLPVIDDLNKQARETHRQMDDAKKAILEQSM